MDYLLHIIVLCGLYTVLTVSLDLLVGRTGLVSVAHAGFVGLGAYSSALLVTSGDVPFIAGVLAGAVVSCMAALVVALSSIRLQEDHFVIGTFAFQMIIFSVLQNWSTVTSGPLGIAGIPPPDILGWRVDSSFEFAALAVLSALSSYWVVWRISSQPLGRVLSAIREDEIFAASLGKNVTRAKTEALAVSAVLASIAGSLSAHYVSYIDPSRFGVNESILIVSMVIIGGSGGKWGPFVGAVLLTSLPEALRFMGLPNAIAANVRQIVFGLLLLLAMLFRPQGIAGRYGFGR